MIARRQFLTGLAAALAAPAIVRVIPVAPEALLPYQQQIADAVAKYWSRKMAAAFIKEIESVFA